MVNLILAVCIQSSTPIDCNTLIAIAKTESSLNFRATGKSHNEIGLFQLRPEFHSCAVYDPVKNIKCAIKYLEKIKKRHYSTYGECYISFYNYGPNYKLKQPCNTSYYKKVKKYRELYAIY